MAEGASQVNVRWIEGKRLEVSAGGNSLIVDQIQADGTGSAGFRPTDLLLGALGACTMGTLLTFCNNMKIPLESFEIDVEGKRDTAPDRVSEIQVSLNVSGDIPADRLETLKRVAGGCRIHYTLKHSPKIEMKLKVGETTI